MKNKFVHFFLITIALLTSLNSSIRADDNAWSTNGPNGARVYTIAIHPFDNQRIFLGTIENGIYQSTNGGGEWFHLDSDSLEETMRVIKFHPLGPDTMFACTIRGIFRSNDGGLNWSCVILPIGNTNEFRTFAICPANPSIMLTGAIGDILKSTNGGQNWSRIWVGTSIQDIEFDPLDSNRVYYASEASITRNSIFRSDDKGETWINIHNDLDTSGVIWDFTIDPIEPQIIYLAQWVPFDSSTRCVSKTTDGGNHWIDITPPDLSRAWTTHVTISPSDHNTVYVCTFADGVLRTCDGGNTWHKINQGLHTLSTEELVIDSLTGIIYLGTYYDGIYRSTNGGNNWEKISYRINNADCLNIALNGRFPDSIFVATRAGLYLSEDAAQNWEYIDLNVPITFNVTGYVIADKLDPDYVFVSCCSWGSVDPGGIARSTDSGLSWELLNTGLPYDFCAPDMDISYYSDGSRRIFAGSYDGIYFSDDLGGSWDLCQGGLPPNFNCYTIDVSPANSDLIFAVGEVYGLYKSTDRGQTWNNLAFPLGSYIYDFACDPINPDIAYVTSSNNIGLYKTTDGGVNWFDSNNNIPRYSEDFYIASGIAINPLNPDNLYVNSYNKGVFVSHNAGQTWEDFNDGLRTGYPLANSILVDPTDTCRIYLATDTYSVWSITRTLTDSQDGPQIPDKFITLSNYPNPFNSSTVIKFSAKESEHITLDIYDLLGQRVETIFDGIKQAGQYAFTWDASRYPSGVYFARLRTPDTIKNISMILLK